VPANTADDMSGPILLGLLLLSAVLILIFTRGKLSYKNNVTEM
jgi:LPXTG-motif cell wall-anchored protein